MTYYRDTSQKEIDVVIEEDGIIHPVEIKKATNPDKKIIKTFDVLRKSDHAVGTGLVICMADNVFPIDADNLLLPASII